MGSRYVSHGMGVRRSLKTSVVEPWYRGTRITYISTASLSPAYGASAHVKGAWSQVAASLSSAASMISLSPLLGASATDTATLLDVGVGAAGSETVIVPDLAIGGHNSSLLLIPVAIPSGSRVAVRVQGTRTSPTFVSSLAVTLFATSDYALTPTSVDVIGTSTTTSYGTTLSGASGSWVEITSSTAKDYQSVWLVPSLATNDVPSTQTVEWSLGVGAAGSEVNISSGLVRSANNEAIGNTFPGLIFGGGRIPAGSRLAVRHNFSANPERYAACVIGVPYV